MTWTQRARIAGQTIVYLLAAIGLASLVGVGRVEIARADTAPATKDSAATARAEPVRRELTAEASRGLRTPPEGAQRANRDLGKQLAAERGWKGRQWLCLDVLWWRESNWREDAQNPTSTAYGIAQFLDKTWGTVDAEKTSDPGGQIRAGLEYIDQRYGTPCSAWSFWTAQTPSHWY